MILLLLFLYQLLYSQSNFIEITLQHECSPEYLRYIFRTSFSKNNISGDCSVFDKATHCANSRKTLLLKANFKIIFY